MPRYIQRDRNPTLPIEGYLVEAVRWIGGNLDELRAVFPEVEFTVCVSPQFLEVKTSYGTFAADLEDWVIRTDTNWYGVVRGWAFDQVYGPVPCQPPGPTASC